MASSTSHKPVRRRLSHPLSGADPATLATVLTANGAPALAGLPQVLTACATALVRLPFTIAEWAYVAAKRSAVEPIEAPVFILGHWRSGTTHLYNVMSRDDRLGYVSPFATGLPWDFLLFARLLRPVLEAALPKDRYIDNVTVEPTSPQEDEIALASMTPLSFYHGLYFPRAFHKNFERGLYFDGCSERQIARWRRTLGRLYTKLAIDQGGRRLLIKNPVYTARVGMLRAMWPDARFIHIHRNPYKVFVSMRNFYARLFEQFALQDYGHLDIDAIILENYSRIMGRLVAETADLPPEQFVELSFEDFQQAPLENLQTIYGRLGLEGFDVARPVFADYLAGVSGYRKNVYSYPDEVVEKVSASWTPFIERWGYAAP